MGIKGSWSRVNDINKYNENMARIKANNARLRNAQNSICKCCGEQLKTLGIDDEYITLCGHCGTVVG